MSEKKSVARSLSFALLPAGCGLFAVVVGLLVLAGWILDIEALKGLRSDWIAMKANTAIAFILAGGSLSAAALGEGRSSFLAGTGRALAACVGAIGLLYVFQFAASIDFGLDQLLFNEAPGAVGTLSPGRMAPTSAISFAFVGAALLLVGGGTMAARQAAFLAAAAASLGLVSALAYAYGSFVSSGLGAGAGMAANTAATFIVLSIGILCLRPDRGVVGLLRSPGSAGKIARRLLPVAIVIPSIIGYLRISGERAGAFDSTFGAILVVVSFTVIFSAFVAWSAKSIERSERERRRTEEVLTSSELRFRTIADFTYDWEVWVAIDGTWIYCSPACERITGYAPERFLEDAAFLASITLPEDRPLIARHEAAGLDGAHEIDFRIRRNDGGIRWIGHVCQAIAGPDGRALGRRASNRDITDRKQAEDARLASERRYRILFENMVEGFAYCRMIFDGDEPIDFEYLDVNESFERLTGLKGVTGKRVTEAIPGIKESDPAIFEIYGRVARGGRPERFETELAALAMWFSISVYSPERGYFVAVFDVITERKRAEARIKELNAELEERVGRRTAELESANKELEAFSYSVSHDLRAPLRGIDGWSLALAEDYGPKLDDRAVEYIDMVRAETHRMGRLIDDLLELARVTRIEMRSEEVDLSSLAATVTDRARQSYPGRDIVFRVQPGMKAFGDPQLLDIALSNLVSNACKFTAPRPRAMVEIGLEEAGGTRAFRVRDNGVGFDMAYAGKLFGAFQRLHRSSDFPGTGVGLATVQRIVKRHGGRIWAESRPGEGASFYFTLKETS